MTSVRALALVLAFVACKKSESPSSDKASPTTTAAPTAPAPTADSTGSAAAPRDTTEPPAPGRKDPNRAKEMIIHGAVVLDVRTPEEFAGGHLPNAENIPVDELEAHLNGIEKLVGGDKSKPIVVYCHSGNRAKKATVKLAEAGYTDVVNGGGLDDLQ